MLQLALIRWSGGLRDAEKEARASRIDLTMLIIFASMYASMLFIGLCVCLNNIENIYDIYDIEECQQNQVREAPIWAFIGLYGNITKCNTLL